MAMRPTGKQIRAARALAGLCCGELADLASVHISVVIQAEAGSMTDPAALASLQRALQSCNIEFGPDGWVRHRRETPRVSDAPITAPDNHRALSPARHRKQLRAGRPLAREIGRACRRGRESLGITQLEASDRIGISAEYYARIERGVSVPSTSTLFELVQVFAIDLDALIKQGIGKSHPLARPPGHVYQDVHAVDFGALCRQARKSADLTQHEVSRRIGVSANFYSRIERGTVMPSLAALWLLVLTLDVDINELLRTREQTEDPGSRSPEERQ